MLTRVASVKKIESPLEIVHFTKHLINSTIIKLIFERNLTVAKLKLPTQNLTRREPTHFEQLIAVITCSVFQPMENTVKSAE